MCNFIPGLLLVLKGQIFWVLKVHLGRVFLFYFIYLFIWVLWVFIAAHGLSLVATSGGYSSLQRVGFSLWWLLLLQSTGSRHPGFSSCGSWALERRLSSCGAWAQLLHGMWDLPGAGLEPVSPSLADRFLTTVPPGKSQAEYLMI